MSGEKAEKETGRGEGRACQMIDETKTKATNLDEGLLPLYIKESNMPMKDITTEDITFESCCQAFVKIFFE